MSAEELRENEHNVELDTQSDVTPEESLATVSLKCMTRGNKLQEHPDSSNSLNVFNNNIEQTLQEQFDQSASSMPVKGKSSQKSLNNDGTAINLECNDSKNNIFLEGNPNVRLNPFEDAILKGQLSISREQGIDVKEEDDGLCSQINKDLLQTTLNTEEDIKNETHTIKLPFLLELDDYEASNILGWTLASPGIMEIKMDPNSEAPDNILRIRRTDSFRCLIESGNIMRYQELKQKYAPKDIFEINGMTPQDAINWMEQCSKSTAEDKDLLFEEYAPKDIFDDNEMSAQDTINWMEHCTKSAADESKNILDINGMTPQETINWMGQCTKSVDEDKIQFSEEYAPQNIYEINGMTPQEAINWIEQCTKSVDEDKIQNDIPEEWLRAVEDLSVENISVSDLLLGSNPVTPNQTEEDTYVCDLKEFEIKDGCSGVGVIEGPKTVSFPVEEDGELITYIVPSETGVFHLKKGEDCETKSPEDLEQARKLTKESSLMSLQRNPSPSVIQKKKKRDSSVKKEKQSSLKKSNKSKQSDSSKSEETNLPSNRKEEKKKRSWFRFWF